MGSSEISELDAVAIVESVQSGNLSPVEVAETTAAAIDRSNATLNYMCYFDADRMVARAREIERSRSRGSATGSLASVPIGVKDTLFVKGMPATAGCRGYADLVPDSDEISVERVRDAGCIVAGKTNAAELAFSGTGGNPLFGSALNPWDTRLTPGGSSSGSAVAVAARVLPVALGTDALGSVRVPAAFCGIFGYKPTRGLVPLYPACRDPRYPGLSSFGSLTQIGPLCRTVRDARLVMSVLSGYDSRDPYSAPVARVRPHGGQFKAPYKGTVAYSPDFGYAHVNGEIADATRRVAAILESDLGFRVEEVDIRWPDPFRHLWDIVASETDLHGVRELVGRCGDDISPHIRAFSESSWSDEQLTSVEGVRSAVRSSLNALMSEYDLILSPATAELPFDVTKDAPEWNDNWSPFVVPMNLSGQPAASIPAAVSRVGLPMAVQLAGRRFEDEFLLDVCESLEHANPWSGRRPPDC